MRDFQMECFTELTDSGGKHDTEANKYGKLVSYSREGEKTVIQSAHTGVDGLLVCAHKIVFMHVLHMQTNDEADQ